MNIVFHKYGNICEQDVIDSFSRLGIQVIEDDIEVNNRSVSSGKRIEVLGELILKNKPTFVFSINFFPYISEICNRLGFMYLCLSVDCPIMELYTPSIQNKNNRVFLFDYKQFQSVSALNPDCIFYLPLATNTIRWESVLGKMINEPTFLYDVSFVGSLYNEKSIYPFLDFKQYDRGYIDGIIEVSKQMPDLFLTEEVMDDKISKTICQAISNYDQNLSGRYDLEGLLIDRDKYVAINYVIGMELSAIERMNILYGLSSFANVDIFTSSDASLLTEAKVHKPVSTHLEMPKVFSQSKINLNITMRGIQTGLSQRIWDVLGCGGFLITDYQEELPDYFELGKELVCYENEVECGELVEYYLKHNDERRQIALNGYKKVRSQHTYDHRIAQMISMVVKGTEY